MIIINQPRQTGKTQFLLDILNRDKKSVLIVPTKISKDVAIERFVKHFEKKAPTKRIYSFDEWLKKKRRRTFDRILIDELDWCLSLFFMNTKIVATRTSEELEFLQRNILTMKK